MSDDGTGGRRGDRQRPPAGSARPSTARSSGPRSGPVAPTRPGSTAYTAMREVADGAYANLALPRLLREKRIDRARRRRSRPSSSTARRGWRASTTRSSPSAAAGRSTRSTRNVLDTLRLGAHQLLGMRVATHAAVDETVALARQVNGAGAAGFVNAVHAAHQRARAGGVGRTRWPRPGLERLAAARRAPTGVGGPGPCAPPSSATAPRPPTTSRRRLDALLEVDNEPAKVSLVARPGLSTLDELEDFGAERTGLSPVGAVLPEGDPGAVDAVRDGRAAVQDEGSQLLVLALAARRRRGRGRRPTSAGWTCCAGPGGKAGLLARHSPSSDESPSWPTRSASTAPTSSGRRWQRRVPRRAQADTSLKVRHGDGREIGEVEPGGIQPGAHRRTVHRAGGAAAPTRGALAAQPRRRRRPGRAAARAARRRASTRPRRVGSSATRRAARTSTRPASSSPTSSSAATTSSWSTRAGSSSTRQGEPLAGAGEGPFVQLWPHVHGTDAMFFALLRRR